VVVGVLQFDLHVPWAESLKDKRRVVRSVKDRLHREHQVSVAEVDALDSHTRAVLGIAVVAADGARAGQVLDRITEKLRALTDAELGQTRRDILRGSQIEDAGDGTVPSGAQTQAFADEIEAMARLAEGARA
jgi:uncharacterized protein YlxP (DUF503 family)